MEKQKVDHMQFRGAPRLARIGRCRTQLTVFQVIGHVVIWLFISAVTLGIGALLWPYVAAKLILESVILIGEDGRANATLRCNFGFSEQIGHAVLWWIVIAVTGGLAGFCYLFGVAHFVLNRTEMISV